MLCLPVYRLSAEHPKPFSSSLLSHQTPFCRWNTESQGDCIHDTVHQNTGTTGTKKRDLFSNEAKSNVPESGHGLKGGVDPICACFTSLESSRAEQNCACAQTFASRKQRSWGKYFHESVEWLPFITECTGKWPLHEQHIAMDSEPLIQNLRTIWSTTDPTCSLHYCRSYCTTDPIAASRSKSISTNTGTNGTTQHIRKQLQQRTSYWPMKNTWVIGQWKAQVLKHFDICCNRAVVDSGFLSRFGIYKVTVRP